jgi:hypothetical protein
MREKGIGFKQTANAFLKCAVPDRLQELALTARDLVTCGQKWLTHFTPFFTAKEREHAGASIGCSSRKSNIATTSSSIAVRHWIILANASSMPIEQSGSRTRSP